MTETEIKNMVSQQRSFFYTGTTLDINYRILALK